MMARAITVLRKDVRTSLQESCFQCLLITPLQTAKMVTNSNLAGVSAFQVFGQGKGLVYNAMNPRALVIALFCFLLSLPAAFATTHRTYSPRPSSSHHNTARSSSAVRPNYGGGHHTTSHGGNYPGETNAHHKNGHYRNWRSANRYGVHKPN